MKQQGVIFNNRTGELWRAEWTWFNVSLLIRSSNFQGCSFEHDVDFAQLLKYSPRPLIELSLSLGLSEKSAMDLGNHESFHFSYYASKIWNSLPDTYETLNFIEFKQEILRYEAFPQ